MALIISNRVREASNTVGTGNFTLAGTALGYQTFFDGIGDGNTTYYAITSALGEWEVGLGTLVGGQLVRTAVLDSSTDGDLVDFVAGPKDVFTTLPASEVVLAERGQTLINKTIALEDNDLQGVQPALVSGDTLKTVNGSSLLGSGDLVVGDVRATTLAASSGAESIGSDDEAGGSLWTTVAGFVTWTKDQIGDTPSITPITSVTDASYELEVVDAGKLLRFTNTSSKTLVVDSSTGHSVGTLYHVSNRAVSGGLTLTAAGSMVLNPPKGGTLVLEPGDTVSLHVVTADMMDVYGSTEPAE